MVSLGINVQPKHTTQSDRGASRILNYKSVERHKSALEGCALLLIVDFIASACQCFFFEVPLLKSEYCR